jgi:2-(1,2-epoxy-1,2-dihydrophenyl)acetyl-CoA isomerase
MALLGTTLSAADAERFGLVSRVVASDALAAEARSAASTLAGLAPGALALTKRALQRSWSVDLDDALDDEAYRQGIAGASSDHDPRASPLTDRPLAALDGVRGPTVPFLPNDR